MELQQAIGALSPRKRACVVLRYLVGMTEAQTAQALGIMPGTVYPGGSCSQYCTQIYDAAGAVWEPTSRQILRIDPATMPG
jgi:hypothetical protein